MNDDQYGDLHAWIEPEIEARLVALVLGEASDFEADELRRMMEERPELRVFKEQLESVHGLLGAAVKPGDDEEWRLSSARRGALMEAFGVEVEEEEEAVEVLPVVSDGREARIRKQAKRVAIMVAACLMVAAVVTPMLFKSLGRSLDTKSEGERKTRSLGLAEPMDGVDLAGGAQSEDMPSAVRFYREADKVAKPAVFGLYDGSVNEESSEVSDGLAAVRESLSVAGESASRRDALVLPGKPSSAAQKVNAAAGNRRVDARFEEVDSEAKPAPPMTGPAPVAAPVVPSFGLASEQSGEESDRFEREKGRPVEQPVVAGNGVVNEELGESLFYAGAVMGGGSEAEPDYVSAEKRGRDVDGVVSGGFAGVAQRGEDLGGQAPGDDRFGEVDHHAFVPSAEGERGLGTGVAAPGSGGRAAGQNLSVSGAVDAPEALVDRLANQGKAVVNDSEMDESKAFFESKFAKAKGEVTTGVADLVDQPITLSVVPEVTEFEGFLNASGALAKTEPQAGDANGREYSRWRTDGETLGKGLEVAGKESNRDFLYETEYEPPELPNFSGASGLRPGDGAVPRNNIDAILNSPLHEAAKDGETQLWDRDEDRVVRRELAEDEKLAKMPAASQAPVPAEPTTDFGNGDSFGDGWGSGGEGQAAISSGARIKLGDVREGGALVDGTTAASIVDGDGLKRQTANQDAKTLFGNDPGSELARQDRGFVDESLRTNLALSKEQTKNVGLVRRKLYTGEGLYHLGKFDDAQAQFEETLRVDPENTAARQWMDKISSAKSDYYRAAYDETRSKMLAEVDNAWELSVPPAPEAGLLPARGRGSEEREKLERQVAQLEEAQRKIVDVKKNATFYRATVEKDVAKSDAYKGVAGKRQNAIDEIEAAQGQLAAMAEGAEKADLESSVRNFKKTAEKYEMELEEMEKRGRESDVAALASREEIDLSKVQAELSRLRGVRDEMDGRLGGGGSGGGGGYVANDANTGTVYSVNKLKSIVIPTIDFEETTVEEAIDFLRQRSRELDTTELDSDRKGVNFVVRQARVDGGSADDALDADGGLGHPGSAPIKNLKLENVTMEQALQAIADQAGMRYQVDDYAVTMLPAGAGEGEDPMTRRWKVPRTFVTDLEGGSADANADDPFADAGSNTSLNSGLTARRPLIEVLKDRGMTFPEGSSVSYLPGSSVLVVKNTPSNLDMVDVLVDGIIGSPSSEPPVDLSGLMERLDESGGSAEATEAVRVATDKLKNIIIPVVDFDATTVEEALDFLEQRSKELDRSSLDVGKVGLEFGVRKARVEGGYESLDALDADLLGGGGAPGQASIKELKLRNVPVATVLQYVADQAGLRYKIEADGKIVMLPASSAEGEDPMSRAWMVHPDVLQELERPQGNYNQDDPFSDEGAEPGEDLPPRSLIDILKDHGVTFPEGTKVSYLAESQTLVVNNTPSNLDLVDVLMEGTAERVAMEKKSQKLAEEQGEKSAAAEAFSTFSLHVSDVSFKLAQASLVKGEWPEVERIRVEEFVNAFDYGDPSPAQGEKVACQVEQAAHPFMQQRNVMRIAMQTAAVGRASGTPLRLTILLDNSGSMERADRAEAVRSAFALLMGQLTPEDEVTLISFARTPRLLKDGVGGDKAQELLNAIDATPSEGGTNLELALRLGMEKATEHHLEGAQNRVILLTDGAANLGDAKPERLKGMVETLRQRGIAFDACGVGADGLNDDILEALTRKGDGRYYFLDRPEDADEGFAKQIAGALRPAAKNVKVQVEFNPKRVGHYALYGFEKHELKKEDFRNDSVDAAELAAEEAGVAMYHVEMLPDGDGDVGTVSVRFQDMATGEMVEKTWPIPYESSPAALENAAPSMRLAASAAFLGETLKGSAVGNLVELGTLSRVARSLQTVYPENERVGQLIEMVEKVRGMR